MCHQLKVVLIFIDGLGIGINNSEINPCAAAEIKLFNHFINEFFPKRIVFNGLALPLDASLGVAGLPQSATGQTTLLTGLNAAQQLGYHLQGFPNETLRLVIAEHSLLKHVAAADLKPAFINAYPPIYFELGPEHLKHRLSVTSHATLASGFRFFNFDDVLQEQAIYQEFTNRALIAKGFQLPLFTPEKAGEILARAIQKFDFSLYEYFQTDHAGHAQNFATALQELIKLEALVLTFLKNIDLSRTLVILTSDHGNIEDLSVRTHTYNPAMTLLWGPQTDELACQLHSIQDVTPQILRRLNTHATGFQSGHINKTSARSRRLIRSIGHVRKSRD